MRRLIKAYPRNFRETRVIAHASFRCDCVPVTDEKKNPLGPVGERVRGNVQRLREARGMTKKQLSDAVGALHRPIPPLGISRVESGSRRVDADDLVALALALKVTPLTLLLPDTWNDEPAELAPGFFLKTRTAWRWAEGQSPADDWATEPEGADLDDEREQEYLKERELYALLAQPIGRRRAAQQSANRAADAVGRAVGLLVTAAEGEDPAAVERQLRITKNRLAQLQNEVEQIELELEHQ
ncbi:helix-turn-helix domain-containing protein [Streptomyces microflavus]|uniref:helix-turn-helix domain-containing protein n=1 Tax=Streptomyces microflavus TaxID=1919 RepID=UPI003F4F374A